MSQSNREKEINNQIQEINNLINQIYSQINFKVDINELDEVTTNKNELFSKFIEKINRFDEIVKKNKNPSKELGFYPDDNKRLINIYNELSKEIKFEPKKNIGKIIYDNINDKKIFYNYLNYSDLSRPLVNLYLTSFVGKLVSLNMCFKYFNLFIDDYESNTSYAKTFLSTNLLTKNYFTKFLTKIVNEQNYKIITNKDYAQDYYCNEFKVLENKIEENNGKIKIKLQTDNLYEIANPKNKNLLTFYIVINYGIIEQFEKNEENIGIKKTIYEMCVTKENKGFTSYDREILGKNKPSKFIMKFSIYDENNNKIFNNIELNINYYDCKFTDGYFYNNVHSRYECVMYINNRPFYLNPYEKKSEIFNDVIV